MKQNNKPSYKSYSNSNIFQKGPKSFFKKIIQLSESILAQEAFQEQVQIIHNQINQNDYQGRQCKKKSHLNLPLKHLLTILEDKSCLSSQFEQQ